MPILQALVLPHAPVLVTEVGKGEEKEAKETVDSYQKVMKEASKLPFDTVILVSPHREAYSDVFAIEGNKIGVASFARFGAPEVKFKENYDKELTQEIVEEARKADLPVYLDSYGSPDFTEDHGSMVPLYFLEKERKDFSLVRLSLSGLSYASHYRLGMAIKEAVKKTGRKVLFLASGDMSHCQKEDGPYGFKQVGVDYDKELIEVLKRADFLSLLSFRYPFVEEAESCGHASFSMMAGALDREDVETKFYSHEAPFGIGYGILSYTPIKEDPDRNILDQYLGREKKRIASLSKDPYVELARKSLQDSLEGKTETELPSFKEGKRGCFVSLHLFSQLRGCVGTMLPTKSDLAEEIYSNARLAAFEDDRFDPVKKEELPYLDISVDVLSPLEKISSRKQLDPKKYGVYVRSDDGRSGVLLPDLEGVDTIQEQVRIAKRKGNILEEEDCSYYRFSVERHAEKRHCSYCFHHCVLEEGKTGFCKARTLKNGENVPLYYGVASSLALDPIEKKPLQRFYPGTKILSFGSYGCNLDCPFCQNYEISREFKPDKTHLFTPEELVDLALRLKKEQGNIGIAFTYNEPLIQFEFVRDTAKLAKEKGLKTVVVTNGCFSLEVLDAIAPYIDAMNIDLKGYSIPFFSYVEGNLEMTKNFIREAVKKGIHVEITTLVIPGKNDDPKPFEEEVSFLASLSKEIPLHITRYFPCREEVAEMTPKETLEELYSIAKKKLKYVYLGNI